jgi:hypothetical protein
MASQFGLLITLNPQTILIHISQIISDISIVELVGVLLQLLGGVLLVTGLIVSVSSIVEIKFEDERRNLLAEFLPIFEERIANVFTSQATAQKCKFCGTPLKAGAIFCSSCGRSQG